ncbi:MAG: polymerase, beta-like protein region protein [Microgenomates group bacterium GW2011_GWA1_Microgenomates_45_10]|nr:MAG: polymerase, beta-like protein region protein [Microgenomates group bacterium GW2011_GWA2_44_7]KKT77921.1 MAG: polymerase, beta-like protein region protein [Microgenomates group bacterium GW2011_GWB1_44_8]KKT86943.1 MAG: polymerase, beta-like protein region protein [Microgenomates group bacterium GW2011_GWA1_Microgenomates_45_10]
MIDALAIAKKYISAIKQSGVRVNVAYLYGSYAKGTPRKDSDIDICIVSPAFGKDYLAEMVRLSKIRRKIDERIEPIPLTPQDLKDPYDSLVQEIRKNGIKIT